MFRSQAAVKLDLKHFAKANGVVIGQFLFLTPKGINSFIINVTELFENMILRYITRIFGFYGNPRVPRSSRKTYEVAKCYIP